MKTNLTFVSLLAVLVMAMGFTSALADFEVVEFNNIGLDLAAASSPVIAVSPGEVVPIQVVFTANDNASNVELEVEIKGRNGVSVQKEISDIRAGSIYSSLLKLKLPEDTDDLAEEFTLYVTVSSNVDTDKVALPITVSVQKESYTLEILSVDYSSKVASGNNFPVTVVVKNTGYNRADDVYVVASIPALGLTTRGYMGDIVVTEEDDSDDEEDSVEKEVYLAVPEGVETGVYELVVEVYNDDSSTEVSKLLSVSGVSSEESSEEVLESDSKVSTSVIALTVILAVIFVVLLAVLVVLLTKKEKPIEEVETSYY